MPCCEKLRRNTMGRKGNMQNEKSLSVELRGLTSGVVYSATGHALERERERRDRERTQEH
jgi:hypothetical protein